ncbi:MAG: phosphoribosylformylglycinamidine synthase subunit PurS [Candidatus Melainabacteria bacterium]
MTTTQLLAEGKTKVIQATDTPGEVLVTFKDDATAFNAAKHAVVAGKGKLNAQISRILFDMLNSHNIPTCYRRPGQEENELIYTALTMIPLEVVIRNVALGSILKRYPLTEGQRFEKPVLELFFKSDTDPLINDEMVETLGLIPPTTTLETLKRITYQINELFVQYFEACGILCADFKLEFGVDADGHLLLGDELSPDNFRFRDLKTGQVLDKDVFRLDLADLATTYEDLLSRLKPDAPATRPAARTTYYGEVIVHSRKNILNPESQTILKSLKNLGFNSVTALEAGKRFAVTLETATMIDAEVQLKAMAERLLANTVIEDYTYSLSLTPPVQDPAHS